MYTELIWYNCSKSINEQLIIAIIINYSLQTLP